MKAPPRWHNSPCWILTALAALESQAIGQGRQAQAFPSTWVGGYARDVQGEVIEYDSALSEVRTALLVRSLDAERPIEWETQPVPGDFAGERAAFVWLFGTDAESERHRFTLSVAGQAWIVLENPPATTLEPWVVEGAHGSRLSLRPTRIDRHGDVFEGLAMETLWRVARSMQEAAAAAGVALVTGDTKVVDRGKGDGLFVTTAGIGTVGHPLTIAPASVRAGDAVLLSGDIGRHGIAIMAVREGLEFESPIESDCAPVAGIVQALIDAGLEIHCLRDLTRGGLASALVEIATASGCGIHITETAIPVHEAVRGACEILGFDPLYVANEGRFVAFVSSEDGLGTATGGFNQIYWRDRRSRRFR